MRAPKRETDPLCAHPRAPASAATPASLSGGVTDISYPLRPARPTSGVAYYMRVLRVVGVIEFKAKYAGAVLGYLWSLAKPLAYFGVLWLVFAHLLRTANQTHDFTLFLLIGILLFTFFADTVEVMMPSIVEGGSILRRLSFPPILVPLSASVGVCVTFLVNVSVIVLFIGFNRVAPRPAWFLVLPLLVELYVFCLGVGLLLAALYVRFRDVGQIWELGVQLLFFASAIFYPIGILPAWAQKVAFINPFVQVMQDVRHAILGASGTNDITAATVYSGAGGRTVPIVVAVLIFVGALAFFRREARFFAERV
jgi:ABC-2 type transport system permease protein